MNKKFLFVLALPCFLCSCGENESVSNEEESVSNGKDELNVYDIVLAGVVREKD